MESQVKIGFFKRLIYSFTHFSVYETIVKEKKRKALGYYFMIKFISILILLTFMYQSYIRTENSLMEMLTSESFPDFSIHDGKAHVEISKSPYVYKNTEVGFNLIIDHHSNYEAATYEATGVLIIFDQEGIYVLQQGITMIPLIEFNNEVQFEIDKAGLIDLLDRLKNIIRIYLLVVMFFGLLFGSLVELLFFSIIAYILSIIIGKSRLTYGISFRIVCYALTLNVFLTTVFDLLTFSNFAISITLFGINIFIFSRAIIQIIKGSSISQNTL